MCFGECFKEFLCLYQWHLLTWFGTRSLGQYVKADFLPLELLVHDGVDGHWLGLGECHRVRSLLSLLSPVQNGSMQQWHNDDIRNLQSQSDLNQDWRGLETIVILGLPGYHVQGRGGDLWMAKIFSLKYKWQGTWQTTKQNAVITVILTVFILTILSNLALSPDTTMQLCL